MDDSRASRRAQEIISELGITSPEEIDIEAIAFDGGVSVLYEQLNGCEATLVGYGERAIATISPSSSRGRERFSIAHEVGHWHLHRGRSFRCRVDDFVQNFGSNADFEKEADNFASNLLLPTNIFQPIIKAITRPGLKELKDVADNFQVSLQAVSIRLATLDTLPVIVACYSKNGLRWHIRAKHIPNRWYIKKYLDDDSFAYDVLNEGKLYNNLGVQPAETWFDNDDASHYEILEHSMPSVNGQVLVLLYLKDPEMFELRYGRNQRYS